MTRNSGVLRGVILAVLTSLITLIGGLSSPASAATDWNPAAPVPRDVCGTSQDAFFIPESSNNDTAYSWNGASVNTGIWNSTGGAASVTIVASYMVIADPQPADVSFTLMFGVEPDSSCVEAADTVTTRIVACNTATNGTTVEFVYTNVDDATDRAHTRPVLLADRWDSGQSASFAFTEGQVVDGQTASIIGGDAGENASYDEFFLAPGTYYMWLSTKEYGRRKLPNTFFVPACGSYKPPKGDPQGGTTTPPAGSVLPKGKLTQVSATKVKVKAINKGVARKTAFKVVIDPVKGKTLTKSFKVAAGKSPAPRYYKASPRARVVLKARVLVEDGNGRLVKQWKVLKRLTLKAR